MITVTLGTIPYPFDRAINWIELLIDKQIISESVFIQHGVSNVAEISRHPLVTVASMVDSKELEKLIFSSRLVISHAGQGSTRKLIETRSNFVLLPRLAKYGEHIDDHQLMFAQSVAHMGIYYCLDFQKLEQAVLNPPPLVDTKFLQKPKLTDHLLKRYPP